MPTDNQEALGKAAYEGYVAYSEGKSLVSQASLPEWPELPKPMKEAWVSAALNVIQKEQQHG